MNVPAIRAEGLVRRFGSELAVDGVSFSIDYGEIFGFLGPNGAGKSTTIRMLTGILEPTAGGAEVAGFDVVKEPERVKGSIGYVSQKFSLYGDLTVEENLEFYGQVYELSRAELRENIERVFQLTGLGEYRKKPAAFLSGGWKQRLALGNAFLHRPKVLFLDEPTAGIDPLSRRALWEILYQLSEEGVALFVTTHYMEEAERCNQIAFIEKGRLLAIGAPRDLRAGVTGRLLEVECSPLMRASRVFRDIEGLLGLTAYGTSLHLNVADETKAERSLREIAKREGIQISGIHPISASLEDVFATFENKSE